MDHLDRYTCAEALRRLEDFLDHELSPDEMKRVHAHLDTCEVCAEKFGFERATLDGLREKLRQTSLPQELRARIARRLDAERRASGQ